MATLAVALTKTTPWRGRTEEWSNVYHFEYSHAMNDAVAGRLIDGLKTLEVPVHAATVTFKTGRLWETGGTPAENETVLIKDLSGTGSLATSQAIYRELTVVVRIDSGRNSTTGRKIYLRKFLHSCSLQSGSNDIGLGVSPLGDTIKTPFVTYGQALREIAPAAGEVYTLQAPSGPNVSPTATVSVLDYLRVRQFTR